MSASVTGGRGKNSPRGRAVPAAAAGSLVDVLRRRAARHPDRPAFAFEGEPGGTASSLTYGELDARARALGAWLGLRGLSGERVVLAFPAGLDFVSAFLGCLYAGAAAVPTSVPRPNRPASRLAGLVDDARPAAVLTTAALLPAVRGWAGHAPGLLGADWLAVESAPEGLARQWRAPAIDPGTLAFLQYTSGSTGSPKGVMVGHGNLLDNLARIGRSFGASESSRGVFWLPLFHDMGLIGGVLQTLYCGGSSTLMSPVGFLQKPARWLEAISRTGATISGGPNFAYELCARKVTEEQKAGLDLSRWSVAFNGAEPVRAETLDRFAEAFAPCGFRREAFLPCYGLAESTLMVTGKRSRGLPRTVTLSAAGLDQGIAVDPEPGADARALVSSGRAFPGLRVEVVDQSTGRPARNDHVGEVWVSGPSVAQGYWDNPDATDETFGARLESGKGPFLRTGDLGFLRGGDLFVTGRLKDVMIVRGRNVYPQDLEWSVAGCHPLVRAEGGAAFSVEVDGDERLVVVQEVERLARGADPGPVLDAVRGALAEQHDLDAHAVCLIKALTLPKTSSGKVRRRACRDAYLDGSLEVVASWVRGEARRPLESGANGAAPKRGALEVERWLIDRLATTLGLDPESVDVRRPFAAFGLGSLQAVGLAGEMETWLGRPLEPTLVYDHPTIEALTRFLAAGPLGAPVPAPEPPRKGEVGPIAVVGVGCRFPGADGPDAFWDLLTEGRDAVGEAPATRRERGESPAPQAGFLRRVDGFDADFFGIAPREATSTDPQQRLLLEVAWEALEDAGIDPDGLRGAEVGVFVGISTNDYGRRLALASDEDRGAHALTGNALSVAANRLSYAFDFRGPSLAVDTACSSSLVAIHLACESLKRGEASVALAGGVNLILSADVTRGFATAGFLSPDHRCRAFDARANGYVRGEGAGVVVLKPLDRALADGDPVYALIRGAAVNQDGRSNGLTAPNREAQEAVLRLAYRNAGVEPGRVDYVEAHGTGTLLGDPIEAAALGAVLGEGRPAGQPCAVGSVKTNLGHLEAAAGIAGLIKAALALRRGTIPASLHFREPNPHVPFGSLPIRVQDRPGPWPDRDRPSLAGVSSFGFGGTNAHVVLESAPARAEAPGERPSSRRSVVPLSARSPAALRELAAAYVDALSAPDAPALADVARTAGARRAHHEHRLALVAGDRAELAARLGAFLGGESSPGYAVGRRMPGRGTRPVFVFSGQGSQWPGMGLALAAAEPVVRDALEDADRRFRDALGWSVLEELAAEGPRSRLDQTLYAQPAVFALQLAVAALWRSWGVVPGTVVGHSLGEVAAAHVAGALSLGDAVRVVSQRARLMQTLVGRGKTAAVALPAAEARKLVAADPERLALAAVNGPSSVVISGETGAVLSAVRTLRGRGVFASVLAGDCAFHGPQTDAVLDEFRRSLRGIAPRPSEVPIVSTVTGEPVDGATLGPDYWARNLREPVRFDRATDRLAGEGFDAFVEVGPHPAVADALRETLAGSGSASGPPAEVVASLRRGEAGTDVIRESAARLYARGLPVDWTRVNPTGRHCRLPRYPFQRERFWIDPPVVAVDAPAAEDHAGRAASTFEIDWRPVPLPAGAADRRGVWVVVEDAGGVGRAFRDALAARGVASVSLNGLGARPQPERLRTAIEHVAAESGAPPAGVVAFVDPDDGRNLENTLAGLLALVRALDGGASPKLWFVTAGGRDAGQGGVWGFGRSVALARPTLWGGLVELDPADLERGAAGLADEVLSRSGEDQVAFRVGRRHVARLVRRPLEPGSGRLPVRADGTYLVTGGLGALGLRLARRLVEQGARRLVLLGRRGLPERSAWDGLDPAGEIGRQAAEVRALERLGATVYAPAADAADPTAMAAVFADLRRLFPPLRGVIHAAGVADPTPFDRLDAGTIREALRSKVGGTLVLDELTRDLPLDFFVLFSSVASVLGAAEAHYAAANGFLDAFARRRRAEGRPALSVNWGPWDGPGMAAEHGRARAFALLGLRPLGFDEAMNALGGLLASGATEALVAEADWSTLRSLDAHGRKLLDDLAGGPRAVGERAKFDSRARLESDLRGRLAAVLRTTPDRIETDRPIDTMGLDSLMAIELKNGLEADLGATLPLADLLRGPTVRGLADAVLARLSGPKPDAADTASKPAGFDGPPSFGQRALWSLHKLAPESPAYNIAGAVRVAGPLDPETLRRSAQRLVDRHGALRTTFPDVGGEPVRRVAPASAVAFAFAFEDLSGVSRGDLDRRLAAEANRPFDLERGPLFRVHLFRAGADDFALVLAVHHAVSDFWSVAVLLDELGRIYPAERDGTTPALPALSQTYDDFVGAQAATVGGPEGDRQWAYWRDRLAGLTSPAVLPTDRPRPALPSFRGAVAFARFEAGLARRLTDVGRARGASLYVTLLSAFQVLVARLSGRDDVVVGSPVAGRDGAGFAGVVGYFVNALPMRTAVDPSERFADRLGRVRSDVLGALEHQDFPFALMADRVEARREPGRSPVFQVMFSLQKAQRLGDDGFSAFVLRGAGPRMTLGGFPVESLPVDVQGTPFDLTVQAAEEGGDLAVSAEYNPDLFDRSTIDRLLGHFRTLLEAFADDPEAVVGDAPILTVAERAAVDRANATDAPLSEKSGFPAAFEAQAARVPDATAVASDVGTLTFQELDERANRLAHHLRSLGVGPDVLVGLALRRTPDLVVAILAVLKAGGAYLPIDPEYPADRLAWMVGDASARVVVTTRELVGRIGVDGVAAVLLDGPDRAEINARPATPTAGVRATPDNLAYVIYTSGSTGKPKGAMVTRRGLSSYLDWCVGAYEVASGAGSPVHSSASFDLTVTSLLAPLAAGRRVRLVPEGPGVEGLARVLREGGGESLVKLTPAHLQLLAQTLKPEEAAGRARVFVVGGEALHAETLAFWREHAPDTAIVNEYGPTETVVGCCVYRVDRDQAGPAEGQIPIGRPTARTRLYVLDRRLNPVPVGVAGELFIGGEGVARGYLNRPGLTASAFVPDPFSPDPGARMYRTGDAARRRADGDFEFLGRVDRQVKVRGQRVEPGEVEAALARCEGVAQAAVLPHEVAPGDTRLVAYVAPESVDVAGLRDALRARLPAVLVPTAFVTLPALPLTVNGKVDRDALPAPAGADLAQTAADPSSRPRGPLEETLASVWSEVLGVAPVGPSDDFFDLGGHSLSAARLLVRVREATGVDLPMRDLFEAPALADFAARVERALVAVDGEPPPPPLLARDPALPTPASSGQRRLWLLDRLDPGRPWYNVPAAVRLGGGLDPDALAGALAEVARRHAPLGSALVERDGGLWQVDASEPPALAFADVSGVADPYREALDRSRSVWWGPFDLGRGPLLRGALYRLGEGDHLLALSAHHAASDGWSVALLVGELAALYGAFAAGRPSPLADPQIRYADYAAWLEAWTSGPLGERELGYWRAALADVPVLELPTDRPRPALPSGRGGLRTRAVSKEVGDALRAVARAEGATPFMGLLAAFQALLGRYSGQADFAVGTPVAGREHPAVEGLIGFFVNTLALRADLAGGPSFRTLLGRVRAATLGAFAHRRLAFERVSAEAGAGRDGLFRVMFAYGNTPGREAGADVPGLRVERVEVPAETAKFDLTLVVEDEPGGGLLCGLEFSGDLFDPATAGRMLDHFAALLASALAEPDRPIEAIPLAEPVPATGQDGGDLSPDGWLFPERFEAQARLAPDAVAVTASDGSLTYAELDRRADRLGRRLAALGAGPDARVGLCLGRSAGMLVGILGVLKAGAAYVPLDPEYPSARLAEMAADSRASVVVTTRDWRDRLPKGVARVVLLDDDQGAEAAPKRAAPGNLAYVIYTSGSTGKPKGVMVTREGLARSTKARGLAYGEQVGRFLMASSFSFDSSVAGIFWTLGQGGELVLPGPGEHADPRALARVVEARSVTHLLTVPSLYRLVLDAAAEGGLAGLKSAIVAGEPCPRDLPARHAAVAPGATLDNEYGPTEATVWATVERVEAVDAGNGPVPIGRAIPGVRAYVLDRFLNPVPAGASGELYLGGGSLARGYLDRPTLTAERFVPDPFGGGPGGRLYRTGDLARVRADGRLDYLGRVDGQVKVRGVRVELGEVEAALATHPAVGASAATVRPGLDGTPALAAYVVPRDGEAVDASALRAWLKARLPDGLIPSAFVRIAALPVSPNGKLDRDGLPDPATLPSMAVAGTTPLSGPTEEGLAAIWAEVLGLGVVGANDDFFDLGGHSLLAARVFARVREAFGVDLPLGDVFEAPTVAGLAGRIDAARRSGRADALPTLVPLDPALPSPASSGQRRLWLLDRLDPGRPWYNVPAAVRLGGGLDPDALAGALAEVARRHAPLGSALVERDGGLWQVDASEPPALAFADVSGAADPWNEALGLSHSVWWGPFDLGRGPLLRGALYRLGEGDHLLALSAHHAASDGWSVALLVGELAALYGAFAAGRPSPLAEPEVRYADYAAWHEACLGGERLENGLAYWRDALAGVPPLELPADRPRPARLSGRGGTRSRLYPAELAEGVRSLARAEAATPFVGLLAAFQALLGRYSGQADFAVGTPVAGREHPAVEGLIGFFVNTLALRADLGGRPSFRDLLRRTRTAWLGAYDHRLVPIERVAPEIGAGSAGVFRVMFAFQNTPQAALSAPGVAVEPVEVPGETAKFDLTLSLTETPTGYRADLEYSRDLFDDATADRILGQYGVLLSAALAGPDRPVDELPLLTEREAVRAVGGRGGPANHDDSADDRDGPEPVADVPDLDLDRLSDEAVDALIGQYLGTDDGHER